MASGELSRCMLQLAGASHSSKSAIERARCTTAASLFLTSDSRIMVSPNAPERRLDVWSLRCLFNLAGLYDRWLKGEFADILPKKRAVTPGSPNAPPNSTFSVTAYYIDRIDGHQLAEVHFFELSDG